jgi:hypothetical protein
MATVARPSMAGKLKGRLMKSPFAFAILLCAVSLGLGGCGNLPERVDMIAAGDTSFMVFCTASTCGERATDICHAQGFSRYDIVDRLKGDELGEGGGIVIQCKT